MGCSCVAILLLIPEPHRAKFVELLESSNI
jgi:hypothetical protein